MRLSLLLLLAVAPAVVAQPKARNFAGVAAVSARFEPASAKPGEKVKLLVTVTPKPDSWTYAITQPNGQPPKLTLAPPKSAAVTFDPVTIADPPGWKDKPGVEAGEVERYYPVPVTWELSGTVNAVPPGKAAFEWTGTRIQACNKDNCYNSKASDLPVLELEVLPGGNAETSPPTPPVPPKEDTSAKPAESKSAGPLVKQSRTGLLSFLGQAAFWGLVSLITPCVFPMIPITVSLFLKQSNQSAAGAVKLALVYCGTITLVLGLSAVLVLSVFAKLSVNPITNVLLALMMLVFALSLFGWFDIRLPNFLLKGAESKRKQGGLVGTVFGAVAFSIVSFTCVAPFLGGFAGLTTSGEYSQFELVLGGLTFGAAFASPFFVLALFPTLLKKLPRSGGWLDTVKAVMGFLELAAAVKFARTAEKVWLDPPEYFTYDVSLTAFIVLSIACGVYLLGLFRLPHDDEERGKIHVLRLMFALGFLGLGVYLLPGLFRGPDGTSQRPKGVVFAWVDAFLLPDNDQPTVFRGGSAEAATVWSRDLDAEVKRIAGEVKAWEAGGKKGEPPAKRFIFVDFTGETCTNCKLNERNVFPQPAVAELLGKYTKVQLYTDIVPKFLYGGAVPSDAEREAEAGRNKQIQIDRFGSEQLPLYVLIEPQATGEAKVLGVYEEGKINNVPAFVEFLRKPLAK
jgi:thiol:disulfide interchange protein